MKDTSWVLIHVQILCICSIILINNSLHVFGDANLLQKKKKKRRFKRNLTWCIFNIISGKLDFLLSFCIINTNIYFQLKCHKTWRVAFMNILNESSHKHEHIHNHSTYTHVQDNKFLLVNIFQNIILYTNIYIYILCRKLYTCLHKRKRKSKALR